MTSLSTVMPRATRRDLRSKTDWKYGYVRASVKPIGAPETIPRGSASVVIVLSPWVSGNGSTDFVPDVAKDRADVSAVSHIRPLPDGSDVIFSPRLAAVS